ncbi:MAG: hypothetical protein HY425_02655 [Candidatus Levybacteria bacterium]|nr:hypothetical protein [Candidatus Levybacteria bacterium]
MAAELDRLGREFGQNNHRVIGGLLRFEGKVAGWLGVPESFSENGNKPEKKLEIEWRRRANRFIELGFHKELIVNGNKVELTVQEYLRSLPKFEPQPKEFKGRLDTPLLVETRVPIERQAQLAGINYLLKELDKKDWPEDQKQYKTPDVPYSTWTDEGARFMNRKIMDVRQELAPDERGGTEWDAVALYIANPNILKKRFLDLPGTAVGSAHAGYLALWGDAPRLGCRWAGDAYPKYDSLVCGRKK